LEHLVYDASGQLTTTNLAEYLIPTACEFPHIRVQATEDHPAPHNPLGAKGAGEGGMVAVAACTANAVAAALKPLGLELRDLPLSPARLWGLVNGGGGVGLTT
jgi:carbon-monoxide dehydrogenase large subunit